MTMENFAVRTNSEVSFLNYSPSTGQVKSISILGKRGLEIPADAVVVCTGAHTARFLYRTLGVFAPITPIKSYTFDCETLSDFTPTHLIFHKSALTAVFLKPGFWRM